MAKPEERTYRSLNCVRRSLRKENHTAEETANGKVGTSNQYGRYFCGPETLNGQSILRGRLQAATLASEQRG
jgi:hypothetical protein